MRFGATVFGGGGGGDCGRCGAIPVRALVDPILNGGDLLGSERAASQRHLRLLEPGHQSVQAALRGFAGNDDSAMVAAFHRGVPRVEAQIRHLLRGAVTVPAAVMEDRLYVFAERNRVGAGYGEDRSGDCQCQSN